MMSAEDVENQTSQNLRRVVVSGAVYAIDPQSAFILNAHSRQEKAAWTTKRAATGPVTVERW